jgi:hypothetical protein
LCYVTSILKTREEFIKDLPSKNEVKQIPISAQRYVKTRGSKLSKNDWYKDNFVTEKRVITPKVKTPTFSPAKTTLEAKDRFLKVGIQQTNVGVATIDQVNLALKAIESEAKYGKINVSALSFEKLSAKTAASYQGTNAAGINILRVNTSNFGTLNKFKPIESYSSVISKIDNRILDLNKSIDGYKSKLGVSKSRDRAYKSDIKKANGQISIFDSEKRKLLNKIDSGYKELPFTYSTSLDSIESQSRGSIVHEIGHYRDEKLKATLNDRFKMNSKLAASEYGRVNSEEYFAEMYAKYRLSGAKDIPSDILELFKEIK